VPVEELEAYGTMLVEFYAREVIAQRRGAVPAGMVYNEDVEMTASVPNSP
jgi:PHO85 cyclin-6/7